MCDRINALYEALRAGPKVWAGQLWDPTWFSQFGHIGCGELLSLHRPDVVGDALSDLLQAGADGVSTNTFGATPSVMITNGVSPGIAKELAFEVNLQSARIARQVAQEYGSLNHVRWVTGSIGPTQHCLTLLNDQSRFHQLADEYYNQASALWQGGVDVLHLESCMDLQNVRAALVGFERLRTELGHRIPVMLTANIQPTGIMLDSSTAEEFIEVAERIEPIAIGLTGRNLDSLPRLLTQTDTWGIALPDVFAVASQERWLITPSSLADQLRKFVHSGRVRIVGVGLGAQPEYVRSIAN